MAPEPQFSVASLKEEPDGFSEDSFIKRKTDCIVEACDRQDFAALRALAESREGFLTDALRQRAWPILLGLSDSDLGPVQRPRHDGTGTSGGSWKELARHRDEDQVKLDVDRAFVYYPTDTSDRELTDNKRHLSNLIVGVLRRYPWLCYFQGYHDICQVFLLVLRPAQQAEAIARLCALRIRDFMLPSLNPAIAQLRLIPVILRAADPSLWNHLSETQPFFALSGTLTMYAHDITRLGEIARLFDVLLAREPVFSVYMFARIVLDRREELFDIPATEPEMLHSMLSKLPKDLDLDALIVGAVALFDAHPPETLGVAWRVGISSASVLKTARQPEQSATQTMEDGQRFFEKQVRELDWQEKRDKTLAMLWKYRRPAQTVGLALFVGALAVWLRRSPGSAALLWTLVGRFRR